MALDYSLVIAFTPLAHSMAVDYWKRWKKAPHLSLDDMKGVAILALVEASQRFDPTSGAAFSAYAAKWVLRGLQTHTRKQHYWAPSVPDRIYRNVAKVNKAFTQMQRETGRHPSSSEIGRKLSLSEDAVQRCLATNIAGHPVSLSISAGEGTARLEDFIVSPRALWTDGTVSTDELSLQWSRYLSYALYRLPSRERRIIQRRFGLGGDPVTAVKVAKNFRCSESTVHHTVRRALRKLHESMMAMADSEKREMQRGAE